MNLETISGTQIGNVAAPRAQIDQATMDAAMKLEATFISELLKSAGVGQTPSEFGGGTGEEQFGSFLRELQAKEIVKAGGVGLAEEFYQSMIGLPDA